MADFHENIDPDSEGSDIFFDARENPLNEMLDRRQVEEPALSLLQNTSWSNSTNLCSFDSTFNKTILESGQTYGQLLSAHHVPNISSNDSRLLSSEGFSQASQQKDLSKKNSTCIASFLEGSGEPLDHEKHNCTVATQSSSQKDFLGPPVIESESSAFHHEHHDPMKPSRKAEVEFHVENSLSPKDTYNLRLAPESYSLSKQNLHLESCQTQEQSELRNDTAFSVSEDSPEENKDGAVSTDQPASGATSMIPVRNLDTGLVQFFDASAPRNAAEEFLNLYSTNNVDINLLRQTVLQKNPKDSFKGETFHSHSDHDTDSHTALQRSDSRFTGSRQNESTLAPKLEKIKTTWRSIILRNDRKNNGSLPNNPSEKQSHPAESESTFKISRFKSFMTRKTENLSLSKSQFSDSLGQGKDDNSQNSQPSLIGSPILGSLNWKTVKLPSHPSLVRVQKSLGKESQTLTNLWLIQELQIPKPEPIWSFSISHDGRWIAAGTQTGTLHLWKLELPIPQQEEEEEEEEKEQDNTYSQNFNLISSQFSLTKHDSDVQKHSLNDFNSTVSLQSEDTPLLLFDPTPTLTLLGHNATIVSCVWDFSSLSKNVNRLATASLDRTVRVWTIGDNQQGQLKYSVLLNCGDWATCASFHPTLRDFIYTGALDGVVQLWRTPLNKRHKSDIMFHHPCNTVNSIKVNMLESLRLPDLITSMSVSPNGFFLCVGLRSGRVCVYEAQSLRFYTEIECRNRRGLYSSGRKVTGITWKSDSSAFFVSTSDSRIRLFNTSDFSFLQKFKGHKANQIMLSTNLTTTEDHIVSGSENGFVYIWSVFPSPISNHSLVSRDYSKSKKYAKNFAYEKFKAFNELLTCCVVGNSNFSKGILASLQSLVKKNAHFPSWSALQQTTNTPRSAKQDAYKKDISELVIVTTSYVGSIRIFVNLCPWP